MRIVGTGRTYGPSGAAALREAVIRSGAPRRAATRRAALRGAMLPAAFFAVAVALAGCASEPPATRTVTASMAPVAALAELVTGGRVPVIALLPADRSPHDYEPAPSEVERIRGSLLYLHASEHLDGWLRRAAVAVDGPEARVLAMEDVLGGHGPDHDPHLWLDLDAVASFLPVLAESLAARDPEAAPAYRARAAAALDSLRAFDEDARARLESCHDVPFALLHPAFETFVRRYGLDLFAVIQPHAEGEALPRTMGNVAAALRGRSARIIFAAPQLSDRVAEAMAEEIDGRVAELDPLGGPEVPGRATYLDLLRWNVASLERNLGGGR